MKKFVAELIGTFMLVFIGTGAVVFGNGLDGLGHLGIAFAFGLACLLNRNCFRSSLEPSCFDRYVCKQTFVIFRTCKLHPWTSSWRFPSIWICTLPLG